MVAAVRDARPDIVVSTGDLVDGQLDNLYRSVDLLQSLAPRYGKYAVMGNHEFFAGINESLRFTRDAGFIMLRGKAVTIEKAIRIVGVDDSAGRQMGMVAMLEEDALLAKRDGDSPFTILLKHQPIVREASIGAFDLQLSGHTHRGQIFPFNLITRIFFPYHNGYHDLSMGSALYVSRGTGTWGPPVRFLSPPEVTVIDLVHP
jgi:predicted MPP superfamily phosphohydrolase